MVDVTVAGRLFAGEDGVGYTKEKREKKGERWQDGAAGANGMEQATTTARNGMERTRGSTGKGPPTYGDRVPEATRQNMRGGMQHPNRLSRLGFGRW